MRRRKCCVAAIMFDLLSEFRLALAYCLTFPQDNGGLKPWPTIGGAAGVGRLAGM